jgi:hypothetical protein
MCDDNLYDDDHSFCVPDFVYEDVLEDRNNLEAEVADLRAKLDAMSVIYQGRKFYSA